MTATRSVCRRSSINGSFSNADSSMSSHSEQARCCVTEQVGRRRALLRRRRDPQRSRRRRQCRWRDGACRRAVARRRATVASERRSCRVCRAAPSAGHAAPCRRSPAPPHDARTGRCTPVPPAHEPINQ